MLHMRITSNDLPALKCKHRLSSLQPPSPLCQIEAQEARHHSRVPHPATSRGSVISSYTATPKIMTERTVSSLNDSSTAQMVQILDGGTSQSAYLKRHEVVSYHARCLHGCQQVVVVGNAELSCDPYIPCSNYYDTFDVQ